VWHVPTVCDALSPTLSVPAGPCSSSGGGGILVGAGFRHQHKAAVAVLSVVGRGLLNLVQKTLLVDGAPRVDGRLTLVLAW